MRKVNVRVMFTEELLGTAAANQELHSEFIASKAPDAKTMAEEVEALGAETVEGKAMTVFPRTEDGVPFMWDYQWKGFMKESCKMLRKADGRKSAQLKAYKQEIDGLVFVWPRKVALVVPEGMACEDCQRPLRASTPQGERVALAHSETVPRGTRCEFDVELEKEALLPYLLEWLDYGRKHGAGQWRNSGKGRFVYEARDEDGEVIGSTLPEDKSLPPVYAEA